MSLDIYLRDPTATYPVEYLYETSITHNLGKMAEKAGIYQAIWRPEEIGGKQAEDITNLIEDGLRELKSKPAYFKQFNPPNGWGTYEDLTLFVEAYLAALKDFPKSFIEVSR